MEALAAWLREIIVLLFLVTVIENLVPLRVTRGYVRLATGLLLVVAVARPLLPLAAGPGWEDGWWEGSLRVRVLQLPDAAALEEGQRRRAVELYRQALQAEADRVLADVPGSGASTVRLVIESDPRAADFGQVSRITVQMEGGSEAAEHVRSALAAHFQLSGDDVKIATRR
ncbi:MAG TPA: stage III sporulation protein AF [Bacillota bacterium]|nr:stage III sporulation protein AF [Bacillota bacterium]